MKARPPTIYIEPEIYDVVVLEFHKAAQIYPDQSPEEVRLSESIPNSGGFGDTVRSSI